MAVVRSMYPHARLDGVHLEAARAMAGVIGAFAATDLPEMENRLNDPVPAGMHGYPRPVLANGKVRYVGEPIAVVVAEDESPPPTRPRPSKSSSRRSTAPATC